MQLTFWGVRGSIPAPERSAWRYGGNTPCVELRAGDELFILDAGTGIRELGHQLMAEFASPGLNAHLLLTHYHWDQVMGLPFFEPLYFAGNTLYIYGPQPQADHPMGLRNVLDTLFRPPFFPVSTDVLQAEYLLRELDWESELTIGPTRIRTCRTNHPQGSLAFRFDHGGISLVYATDHEPGNAECDLAVRSLAQGTDLLISDAQYLPEEILGKKGWGHGTWELSAALAREVGAKNLVLFHHDPFRTDEALDHILIRTRQVFPNTWAAAEGTLVEMSREGIRVGSRANRLGQRAPVRLTAVVETSEDGAVVREEAQVENLNLFGAYFYSRRRYEPQQPVELHIPVRAIEGMGLAPDSAGTAGGEAHLRGYVVRVDPVPDNAGWIGVAVHFPGSKVEDTTDAARRRAAETSGTD